MRWGDTLFKIDHWQTLAFHTLKEINDVADVEHTENSIKNASTKVLNHFDINDDKDYDMFLKEIPPSQMTNFLPTRTFFVNFILFLEKRRLMYSEIVGTNVKEHLEEIISLIEWYESHPSIQTFWMNREDLDNHELVFCMIFYSRCLDEQRQILKYFLHGVKERALINRVHCSAGVLAPYSHCPTDTEIIPYEAHHTTTVREYFDCCLIDQAGHRLAEIILYGKEENWKTVFKP